jgi:hypothetical protein
MWRYLHTKRSGRLTGRTIEEEEEIEVSIHHLGLDYFFT